MKFAFEPHQSKSRHLSKSNRCFYNCQCLCCLQGCCVVTIDCCCCCFNSCNIPSNKGFSQPQPPLRKKVPDSEYVGMSKLIGTILVLARWVTALATLLSSCIILDPGTGMGQSAVSGANRPSNKTVTVSVSSSANAVNNNTDAKLKSLYGYTSYELSNDQQLKSNNLSKMFCNSRNRKRQRKRRRRRRRRRRRYRNMVINKLRHIDHQRPRKQKQKQLRTKLQMPNKFFQHNFIFGEGTCHSATLFKENYGTASGLSQLQGSTIRSGKVSSLKNFFTTHISIRSCSKVKRNRTNLIWLLIGLVWFEVKLINCNGISSSNYYVSNVLAHRGCTLCLEGSKTNIYNDKNPHTDYNIYNKYYNNNNFYKKTNQQHYNIVPSDLIRLESIKRQILTKLGLTHKPNVTDPLPKQFIWETIYRADGGRIINAAFESDNKDFNEQNSRLHGRGDTVYENGDRVLRPEQHKLLFLNTSRSNISNKSMRNRTSFGRKHQVQEYNAKHIFNKNFPELQHLQTNSYIASRAIKQHFGLPATTPKQLNITGYGSDSKKVNNISYKKSNRNAFSQSTYLIDINRNSDRIGNNEEIRRNDHDYFNDYSVQSDYKREGQQISNGYYPMTPDKLSSNIDMEKLKQRYDSVISDQEIYDHEEFFGNTQEIITFAEEGTQYRKYQILEFAPQKRRVSNQKMSIRSAQIHIRIEKSQFYWTPKLQSKLHEEHFLNGKRKLRFNKSPHKIKIWIFQLTKGINITEKGIDQAILFRASFEVNTKQLGWKKFDFTETIRDWYDQNSNEKLRLLIDCTGCGDRYYLQLFQTSKFSESSGHFNSNPNRPFLVLHTEATRTRRVRRRAVDCGGALNGQCCKESFYVSFKALGWDDWIIAPRGYFANYCRGDCTGSFRTPDTFQTFHAHFIEEYRKMGLLNGMRPCCAPIKFSSMSLIYYGDDGIIKRDLPKMVVDECGCP
ncbi:hypothetical protein KR018_005518 [Drosophila ironensis]|nr:hypothetical protein KR018_005518 [Drosophila ironensis]